MLKEQLKEWIEEYLKGTDYELITLEVSAGNDILVEVDRLAGVDVDFCAELNRFLVEKIEAYLQQCSTDDHRQSDRAELFTREGKRDLDYSLEVGSVSLTDPFKTKMQFEKNLGHDVEILVEGKKLRGQLVSVDEETFSVDVEEKVRPLPESSTDGHRQSDRAELFTPEGKETKKVRPVKQIVTHTWRYDEPKYVKYDLKI